MGIEPDHVTGRLVRNRGGQVIIHHRLADGTATDSVDGMVISASEHRELYELINEVMKGGDVNEPISTSDSWTETVCQL